MSWQIKSESGTTMVVLASELGIQNAAEFHQAMLPLAARGGPVRIDARTSKTVHTSIMQILYALSQSVPDFAVIGASQDFRAIEARMGFSLPGNDPSKTPVNLPKPA
jgi:anti-anti-sigma regulatory factor